MSCMLILFIGEKLDFSWDHCKSLLANPNFSQKIKSFDIKNIDQEIINRVVPFTKYSQFNFEDQKKNGGCSAYLAEWIIRVLQFHDQFKVYKPLEEEAETMKKEFQIKDEKNKIT